MKAEGYELGRATLERPSIAFKDLLLKHGIDKVAISGFGNGCDGLVKIPVVELKAKAQIPKRLLSVGFHISILYQCT